MNGANKKMQDGKNEKRRIAIFSFTDDGSKLNRSLRESLKQQDVLCESYAVDRFADKYQLSVLPADLKAWIGAQWGRLNFLFIGAAGIAVRYIAPWVVDKFTDSAVLSVDEDGQYVIPLLSGHLGGAVDIARQIAQSIEATPVISTATDRKGRFAVDVFAKKNQLYLGDRQAAKQISAAILEGRAIGFYSIYPVYGEFPKGLKLVSDILELKQYQNAVTVLDSRQYKASIAGLDNGNVKKNRTQLQLYPKNIILGIGCRKGTAKDCLIGQLSALLAHHNLSFQQVQKIVSIDVKKDEMGILEFAAEYGIPFETFSAEELGQVKQVSSSSIFVKETVGVDNVCERAAKRACPEGELIQPKICLDGVTAAIVKADVKVRF
ncbi:MAG: cobalamin biosynthesis protein [Hespellia sp.]|nr:cobalamin biosynthesis protein [Hespellia sp.]